MSFSHARHRGDRRRAPSSPKMTFCAVVKKSKAQFALFDFDLFGGRKQVGRGRHVGWPLRIELVRLWLSLARTSTKEPLTNDAGKIKRGVPQNSAPLVKALPRHVQVVSSEVSGSLDEAGSVSTRAAPLREKQSPIRPTKNSLVI